jgi:hypothetical protein
LLRVGIDQHHARVVLERGHGEVLGKRALPEPPSG